MANKHRNGIKHPPVEMRGSNVSIEGEDVMVFSMYLYDNKKFSPTT